MITLQTGLPGSGKTLYTLSTVNAKSVAENRPVFYDGIADLNLPNWTKIDAEKWYECPPNSLIVIDECQRIFRPRTISKDVPLFVSELETHRHKGLDLWMITQHPMLADSALRRLSGKHIHAIRPFGFQGASLHEWASVRDTCDKSSGRADSIKTKWSYDKKMFSSYKSAEVHTVKRAIPFKVKMLFVLPFLIAGLGYSYYASVMKRIHPDAPVAVAGAVGSAASYQGGSAGKGAYLTPKEDARQYVFQSTPRYEGMPATAPKYDELTKPVAVPIPAACVKSASKGCRCFTQQATPINVTASTCQAIVESGFFQEFDDRPKRVEQSVQNVQRPAGDVVQHGAVVISDRGGARDVGGSASSSVASAGSLDPSRWPPVALLR